VQQEASQRATDGLQPECSDTEEFQAEGRRGGKVPGGREGGGKVPGGREGGGKVPGGREGGGRVTLVVVKGDFLHEKGRARDRSTARDISTRTFLLGCSLTPAFLA